MGKWMRNSTPMLCFNEDEVVGIVEKVQDMIIPNIYCWVKIKTD